MMLNKNNLLYLVLIVAIIFVSTPINAAEDDAANAAKTESSVKKKKKGPSKKLEYFRWSDASKIAQAWEQPILVFVDLKDFKISSRVRSATVGHRIFKDFIKENCIYYRYTIPSVEAKGNRGNKNNKDDIPKPDFTAIKDSEKSIVDTILDGKKKFAFPGIALLKSNGQLLGSVSCDPSNPSLGAFINDLKSLFEKGNYDFTIPKSLQKFLDAEAKKKAALEKRKKK